jgi:hypothetical protein
LLKNTPQKNTKLFFYPPKIPGFFLIFNYKSTKKIQSTPKIAQFFSTPKKYQELFGPQKNTKIQNVDPKKIVRAYVLQTILSIPLGSTNAQRYNSYFDTLGELFLLHPM